MQQNLLFLLLPALLSAQPGALDKSFGGTGIVTTDLGGRYDQVRAMAIQPDGKTILAGSAFNGKDVDFGVSRYLPNGALDTSFNVDGKQAVHYGPAATNGASAVGIQPDGKIVVAGTVSANTTGNDFILARLIPDGTPDAGFGANGLVTADFNGGHDVANSVLIEPTGNIVVAGSSGELSTGHFVMALARYLPSGVPDTTFGVNGATTTSIGPRDAIAWAVLQQPDGKIVCAGYTNQGAEASRYDFAVVRYLVGPAVGVTTPGDANLEAQVYPNPVQSLATLTYVLENETVLSVQLVEVQGRLIRSIINSQVQLPGQHSIPIQIPEALDPGVYFIELSTTNGGKRIKVVK